MKYKKNIQQGINGFTFQIGNMGGDDTSSKYKNMNQVEYFGKSMESGKIIYHNDKRF